MNLRAQHQPPQGMYMLLMVQDQELWTAKETLVGETLTGYIDNISASSTVYVPIPFAGTISKVVTVLEAAISSAPDATLTVKKFSCCIYGNYNCSQFRISSR